MNPFDGLQNAAFNVVTNTMGYDASWSPSAGGPTKTGRVLLKSPTEALGYLGSQEYNLPEWDVNHWMMEYRAGVFDGLKERCDQSEYEVVTIRTVQYMAQKVKAVFDGKTLIASLQPL